MLTHIVDVLCARAEMESALVGKEEQQAIGIGRASERGNWVTHECCVDADAFGRLKGYREVAALVVRPKRIVWYFIL